MSCDQRTCLAKVTLCVDRLGQWQRLRSSGLALALICAAQPGQSLDLGGLGVDVDVDIDRGGIDVGADVDIGGVEVDADVGIGGGGADVGVSLGGSSGGGGGSGGGTGGDGSGGGTGGGSGGGGTGGGSGGDTGGRSSASAGTGASDDGLAPVPASGRMPCAGGGNATAFNGFVVRSMDGEALGWVNDATIGPDQRIRSVKMQSTGKACYAINGGSFQVSGKEVWVNVDSGKFR